MMAMFAWGKLRYDLVALAGLLAAVLAGIVPYDKAFSGFSEDIVIIVGERAAGERRGRALRRDRARDPAASARTSRAPARRSSCSPPPSTVLSAFVKNIGALAMMMPVAFQLARRNNKPVSALLMPMAFGVAARRHRHAGRHLAQHHRVARARGDDRPAVRHVRLHPRRRRARRRGRDLPELRLSAAAARPQGAASRWTPLSISKATPPKRSSRTNSAIVGKTVGDLEAMAEDEIEVLMLLRGRNRRYGPAGDITFKAGDVLLLEGDPAALERVVGAGEAQARARRRQGGERHAARRHRRHGSGDHRQTPG